MVVVKKSDFGHGRVRPLPVHPGQLVVGPAAIPQGFPTGIKAHEGIGKRPVRRQVGRNSEIKQQEMMRRSPMAPVENRELTTGRAVPQPRAENTREKMNRNPMAPRGDRELRPGRINPQPRYDKTRRDIRQNPKEPVRNREPSPERIGPKPKNYGVREKGQKAVIESKRESQKNIQQKTPVGQKAKSTSKEPTKGRRMENSRPVQGQQQNQTSPNRTNDQQFFPH
jgi:hypothetical protein